MARMRNRYDSKTSNVPTVQQLPSTTRRQSRYPKHSWHTAFRPFQLQPCAIAPVQAGDTIKSLRFESRVLTDPIKDQVTGWWSELYFFYVRFSDLEFYSDAQTLAITPSTTAKAGAPASYGSLSTSAKTWTMHGGKGVDWLYECLRAAVVTYFRPENGAWNDYLLDSVPSAGLVGSTWLDTLERSDDLPALDGYYTTGTTETGLYAERFARYEQLRKAKLIQMDYPEYLISQGIDVPQQLKEPIQEKRRPELLRFTRQFSYPANTVKEDGTGTVAAVSWVTSERMDRPIFCDEPGFVIGVQCVRPKLYRSGQTSCGVSLLKDSRTLCPAVDEMAPSETLINFQDGATSGNTTVDGPISVTDASVAGYWVDAAGVFVLGDQFVVGTNVMTTALPDPVSLAHTYPPTADIDALFAGAAKNVKSDGLLSLSITGRIALSTGSQIFTK